MPELPEVEHVASALRALVTTRRIVSAKLLRPLLAPSTNPKTFRALLQGACIDSVSRRGKHLLLNLDNGFTLIVHLRMTGRFVLAGSENDLPKHSHAVFYLDQNQSLIFADQRHFGMMKIVPTGQLGDTRELAYLAPEPLSAEFSTDYLHFALKRSRRTLKDTLIDQKRVTGLGNIYACEVLFDARIDPFRMAANLSRPRIDRLHSAIQETLTRSIAHSSSVVVDPKNIGGGFYPGGNGSRWLVYGRESEPCSVCRTRIKRKMHAGRSTYFCTRCQRY